MFLGKNRRRGRPPKNSNNELVYSPPEKRARSSTDGVTVTLAAPSNISEQVSGLLAASVAAAAANSSATVSLVTTPTTAVTSAGQAAPQAIPLGQNVAATTPSSGGKGGKGIRNRVFCGECPGCLENDDCGKCRYCKDKTKFGGQNRLRQKCLHRRCQMDTHR